MRLFSARRDATMKTTPPLTDAEINELDELLAAVPAPYETVDAVILDGYLAGVLVQPVQLEPEQWLTPVFGTEGMPEPGIEGWSEKQHTRLVTLNTRRKDEILRGILEEGWISSLRRVFSVTRTRSCAASSKKAGSTRSSP